MTRPMTSSSLFTIVTRKYCTKTSGQARIRAVIRGTFRRASIYIYDYALSQEANHRAAADQCASDNGYGFAGDRVHCPTAPDDGYLFGLPEPTRSEY